MASIDTIAAAQAKPLFSNRYKGLVLSLLVGAYTFNFIDRTVVATIGQAIKVDLRLDDAQLGLLGGLSFAILYTLMGIPIARMAERWNRVSIIAWSLVVWSGFTVACGFAGNFLSLLMLRVGVGVGEAGCTPPAHSLISDYYEPKRRASALSIYALGIPLGSMFGAALGGWLAKTYGWRVAFMAVGAPGLILAALIKLMMKEPPRGHSDPKIRATASEAPPATLASELAELGVVTKALFGSWPLLNMVLGITITSFAGYGAGFFAPPYFIRLYGLDYATVGLIVGAIAGVSNGAGTIVGGFSTDWASKHGGAWYALVPAIGLFIATPLYLIAYNQPTWQLAMAALLIPGFFHYMYLAPTFGVVQNAFPAYRRATAAAVTFLFLNLIALGGGPSFTGFMIDRFAQVGFNNGADPSVFHALAALFGHGADAANFKHACPGGAAPHSAGAVAAARCKATLLAATRQGMVVTICIYAWGGVHYILAAFGIGGVLRRAREAAALAAE